MFVNFRALNFFEEEFLSSFVQQFFYLRNFHRMYVFTKMNDVFLIVIICGVIYKMVPKVRK